MSKNGGGHATDLAQLGVPADRPGRERYVQAMFDAISPRYDLLNHLLSLGQDVLWRKRAAAVTCSGDARAVLDVATGTGDLARELRARLGPGGRVVGVDFAPRMLTLARRKLDGNVPLVAGNVLALPFADRSFDAAAMAFVARNVADLVQAFGEMRRVVRPGGRVVCLELSHPRGRIWRQVYRAYFYRAVPRVGRWIIGRAGPYDYLPASLTGFPDQDRLCSIMESAGLVDVSYQSLTGGVAALHVGYVPGAPAGRHTGAEARPSWR